MNSKLATAAAKIASAIDNAISPPPPPAKPVLLILADKVCAFDSSAKPDAATFAELCEFQDKYFADWFAANHIHTEHNAREQWRLGLKAPDTAANWEATRDAAQARQDAAKNRMFETCKAAAPLCRKVIQKFRTATQELLAVTERDERAAAAELGLAVQHSALVSALRRLVTQLQGREDADITPYSCPKELLSFLEFPKQQQPTHQAT